LAGHSIGGYIAGNYAIKYFQRIKKLVLLSPIGVRPREKEDKEEALEKKMGEI